MAAKTAQLQNLDYPIYHCWEESLEQLAIVLTTNPTLSRIKNVIDKINSCRIDEEPFSPEIAEKLLHDLQFRVTVIELLEARIEKYKQLYIDAWLETTESTLGYEKHSHLTKLIQDEMLELGTLTLQTQNLLLAHPEFISILESHFKLNNTNNLEMFMENYRHRYYTRRCLLYFNNKKFCMKSAAKFNHLDVIKKVFETDVSDGDIKDALLYAFQEQRNNIIEFLLKPSNVNFVLNYAAMYGNVEMLLLALERGANDINTAMLYASEWGKYDIVKILLEKGANNFNECLIAAASGIGNSIEIVRLMLDKGATHIREALKGAIKIQNREIAQLLSSLGDFDMEILENEIEEEAWQDMI